MLMLPVQVSYPWHRAVRGLFDVLECNAIAIFVLLRVVLVPDGSMIYPHPTTAVSKTFGAFRQEGPLLPTPPRTMHRSVLLH
ncbi:hypothetical protein BD414DRAFT_502125 [Trametes punicea]|nr:hypothetical protein BD414DRAFT_502125 [Trametes punicea]